MSLLDRLRRLFGGSGTRRNGGAGPEAISCEEALSVINEFLDGELADVSIARVRAHFEVCRRCYPHLRLEEAFRAAVRRASAGEAAPPELRSRVLARLGETDQG